MVVTLSVSIALPARRPVLAEVLPTGLTRSGVTILLGAGLTAVAAQLSFPVPGSPVPVTGQTFAVLLTAAALGPARGLAAQALYLVMGAVGLPVFAGAGHGPGVIFGASGGYLIGFIAAAAITGYGARRGADRSPVLTLLHVPPAVASLNVVVLPTHTVAVPVIIAGTGFTVTIFV